MRGVGYELPRVVGATQVLACDRLCRVGDRCFQKRWAALPRRRHQHSCTNASTSAEPNPCTCDCVPGTVLLRRLQRLLSLELLRGPEHLLGATGTGRL